jgi:hypothetical protein
MIVMIGASLSAEIPMSDYLRRIPAHTHVRLFVETFGKTEFPDDSFRDFLRVQMLEQLIAAKNSPPDLPSAFRVAPPGTKVDEVKHGQLRIIDKDMHPSCTEVLSKQVSVKDYKGPVSTFLEGLTLGKFKVILNRTGTKGTDWPRIQKMNFNLEGFTFTGSFRDLLVSLSATLGSNGSYFVRIDDQFRCVVEFFPVKASP